VTDLRVLGREGVPQSGVGAVALNVTVTDPTSSGYVTVWPTGSPQPVASNVNFRAGETAPNLVIVPVGAADQVSLFVFGAQSQLIVDVAGWFPGDVSAGLIRTSLPETAEPVYDNDSTFREGAIVTGGITALSSIYYEGRPGVNPSWTEYNLGRQWRTLDTTFAFDDTRSPAGSTVLFRLLVDGVEKASSSVTSGQALPVSIDVTNGLRVRFEVTRTVASATAYPAFLSPVVAQ